MNGNYVDVLVFVLLMVEFFIGINKGAILFITDTIGVFVAFFGARYLTSPVAQFLSDKFGLDKIFSEKLASLINLPQGLSTLPLNYNNLNQAVDALKLPSFLRSVALSGNLNLNINVGQYLANILGYYLLLVVSFVLVFLLIIIVFRILGYVLRNLFRVSPFLKWVDMVLGGVVRVFLYLIVISVLVHLLGYIFTFLKLESNSFFKVLISSKTYEISEKYFPLVVNYLNTVFSTFK